jgi:N-hydroxyarylamine O-acetyltransferase
MFQRLVASGPVFDLDRYLERIGLRGSPGIAEVHLAHVTSIPFENLDPHRGVPVALAIPDLERKLLAERRGGYCFEQNLLLKVALEALGAEVEMMLARVRVGAPPGAIRPRSHLLLRVRAEGSTWHADVGFGRGSLFEPIPFGPGPEQGQLGRRFRVVEDGAELVLQTAREEGWEDLYGFAPDPVPLVDVEVASWYTSTYPRSPFVTGLIAGIQGRDGSHTMLSDWGELTLTEDTPTGTTSTPVERAELPELLAANFGLTGFVLGPDGRLLRDP